MSNSAQTWFATELKLTIKDANDVIQYAASKEDLLDGQKINPLKEGNRQWKRLERKPKTMALGPLGNPSGGAEYIDECPPGNSND